MFSAEEMEAIEVYFKANIEANQVPPITRCREFHSLKCDPKQIRDKIHNIIKNK